MKNREKIVANGIDLGYSKQVSRLLGVSPSTVCRWLSGESRPRGLAVQAINDKIPDLWSVINGNSPRAEDRSCDSD